MMVQSYLISSLLLAIYLAIGHSYDEQLTKAYRIKRSVPHTAASNMSTTPPMINITSNRSLTYIITSYTSLATSMQTTQWINQTTSIGTSLPRTSTSTIFSSYNPDTCRDSSYIKLFNGTCVTKLQAQTIATEVLRNRFRNTTNAVYALSLYMSAITNSTTLSNRTNTLSVDEIDEVVDTLSNLHFTMSSNTSFLMVQHPKQENNTIVLGASFTRGIGGELIDRTNRDNITKSRVSAAAMISEASLNGVLSLNLLIIDKPTGYENADTSTNKTLASSVIVAYVRRNSSFYNPITIYLYFRPLEEYKRTGAGNYLCSFYNTNHSEWNESGCTGASYNYNFSRYECNCNHLTTFALIWLPQSISSTTNSTRSLDAQDIASLVFQSISIFCFLALIIHAIYLRIINPSQRLQTLRFLPMISTASTTILFIFFIALSMTVYTQTSSPNEMKCFLTSSVLMFFTYFFLIFMFCLKTSVGYFYYLRFARLFPHPSHRQLLTMLIISLVISLLCVAFAIGFNTNSSFHVIQLYPYRLCWFTRDVIYYFLTIPIGLFLVLNIITITLVSRSIISHAFDGGTHEQIKERLKRCVVVLLSSCVTQGIGWLFGPFISFLDPIAGNILAWFFIILNGLEGFWSIVLYTLIRLQQIDEQKQAAPAIRYPRPIGKSSSEENKFENCVQAMENNRERDQFYSFNDIRKRETDFSNDNRVFH